MIGLHMLHPLQGTAQQGNYVSTPSSSSSNQLRDGSSTSQPNIVRIPAKTALPIVSSVPKCRSSKASRHHPIDTINGSTVSHSNGRATSKNPSNNINQADQVLLIVNDDHIKGGGVPIIGRRLPSKSMAIGLNGSHYGPEIIQNGPESKTHLTNAIDCYQMSTQEITQLDQSALQIQAAPVVGRRSHRFIQQQQQLQRAATAYHQQSAMFDDQIQARQDSSSSSTKKKSIVNNNKSSKYGNQQPLSIVETHLATSQQVHLLSGPSLYVNDQQHQTNHHLSSYSRSSSGNGKSKQKLHPIKYQSISIMNIAEPIAEYSLPPMQQVGRAQNFLQSSSNHHHISYKDLTPKASGRGQALVVTKQIGATRKGDSANSLALGIVPSSSCSSLCSTAANLNNSSCINKQINYGPNGCCSPANCSNNSDQIVLDEPCREPCCQMFGEACGNECDEISCNDSSCNILARVPSCCMPSPVRQQIKKQQQYQMPGKTSNRLHNQPQHQHHDHQLHHHHNNHESHGRQARASNDHHHHHHHHHHHSCQANGSIGMAQKPSTSYRSSSLHDSRRQSNSNTRLQQQQQQCYQQSPMLISGRNILPVHPKPNLNHSSMILNQHCNGTKIIRGTPTSNDQENSNCAVNQMYESLAAELKAKLGDPKMGPILLPPKDYDTMSRKQGKLTGIELRRSTNPQLVGPTAARINTTLNMLHKNRDDSINEDQIVANGSVRDGLVITGSPTGSDRSSGRSQDDRSLQRSRSNSSSGLGSISMGPSSPNSPPISSNEDMRQTNTKKVSSKMYTMAAATTIKEANHEGLHQNLHHHHHHDLQVDRKDSSPDNCNSSDSGHSGSGRLDSAMSSEERKLLHDDTKFDYLKSNNNDNSNSSLSTKNISEKDDDEISGAKTFSTKRNSLDESGRDEKLTNKSYYSKKGASSSFDKDDRGEMKRDTRIHSLNPTKVSSTSLWNGRVEVPLKVNSDKNGNTYLATKQIIY